MRLVVAVCCLLLPGCTRYAEFTLPAQAGSPGKISYQWDVHPFPCSREARIGIGSMP